MTSTRCICMWFHDQLAQKILNGIYRLVLVSRGRCRFWPLAFFTLHSVHGLGEVTMKGGLHGV